MLKSLPPAPTLAEPTKVAVPPVNEIVWAPKDPLAQALIGVPDVISSPKIAS